MKLLYPLGLLGLIAIPVLIIIYILKNKHTEQVVSSTYLWRLSERFLKKRNPISKLTGIISLILQILAVAFISFAVSQPVFTLPNAADDYVFILDASGSMRFEKEGKTRFAWGKEEIEKLISSSANGSSYTLINAGETVGVLFEKVEDKKQALTLLEEAELSATTPNFANARGIAQEYFTENGGAKIYLITDKSYESAQNVEVITLSSQEENYAVSDLKYEIKTDKLVVTGKAYSYESDEENVEVRLEVFGRENNIAPQTKTVSVKKLEGKEFSFDVEGTTFQSLKVTITNEDGLPIDNESMLYNNETSNTENSILIVSDDPAFLKFALTPFYGEDAVQTIDTRTYNGSYEGYQLYIFENYAPDLLPKDGAVWFVNPNDTVDGAGFSVLDEVNFVSFANLRYNTSTSTRIQNLLKDTKGAAWGKEISIGQYVLCGMERNFHNLLYYGSETPVLFAGTNEYENREVVFAFDLHKSNITLHYDFAVLMRNLLAYTFPEIISESAYECGSNVAINVLANCDSLRIDTPEGGIDYLDVGSDMVEYEMTEVGTYTITQMVAGKATTVYAYGNLPMAERAATVKEESFVIEGTPTGEHRDGKYDDLLFLFIIIAAIVLADWGVYCYEQYKLR